MANLGGRTAIVTGGARGIGFAICRALSAAGAHVVVTDLAGVEDAVARLQADGASAEGHLCDVSDRAAVRRAFQHVGHSREGIDILVNNAGLFTGLKFRPFSEIPEDEWERVMRVNVDSVVHCATEVLPFMRAKGGGSIVNIASSTPLFGMAGMLHYVASKGAVIAMTRSMARELGDDRIRVNAVALGFTISEKIAENGDFAGSRERALAARVLKREQTVEDCTGTVLFLAGPDSDFITGQSIVVDGGSVMR